jgi:outer membrane protein assembly factor BamB
MRTPLLVTICLAVVISAVSEPATARGELLVIGKVSRQIIRFNDNTGALISEFSYETEGLEGLTLGADGNLYVTSNTLGYGDVYRFNRNGFYLGTFAGTHLRTPGGLTFGADGNLYVIGSTWPDSPALWQILRYNGTNGAFLDYFIPASADRTNQFTALAFGADGNLYVADYAQGILRFDGNTGAYLDTIVPAGRAGLSQITGFVFGHDGNLYVSSLGSNAVSRFEAGTGTFLGTFVAAGTGGLDQPGGLGFGSDGNLYVSNGGTHSVLRFDGQTGQFLKDFAAFDGEPSPAKLLFAPPLPSLSMKRTAAGLQLSWPSSSPGSWSLCTQEAGTSGKWTAVTNVPMLSGTNYVVTQPMVGNGGLYRLQQQ